MMAHEMASGMRSLSLYQKETATAESIKRLSSMCIVPKNLMMKRTLSW